MEEKKGLEVKEFQVYDSHEFGIENLKKLIRDKLFTESSIKEALYQTYRPSSGTERKYNVATAKTEIYGKIDPKYWIEWDESFIETIIQFRTTNDATPITGNFNFPSIFNFWRDGELDFNGRNIQKVYNIGQINRIKSLLTHSKDYLKENYDYNLHWDEPDTNDDLSGAYAVARKAAFATNAVPTQYKTFRTPLSFFFTIGDSLSKYKYIPANDFRIQIIRDADTAFLSSAKDAANYINLISVRLFLRLVKFSDNVELEVRKLWDKPIVIPFNHYEHTYKAASGTQITREETYRNLTHVVNWFHDSTNIDPYYMQLPKKYEDGKQDERCIVYKRHKVDSTNLYDSPTEIVVDGTQATASIGWSQYLRALRFFGVKDQTPITHEDMYKFRPLFITRMIPSVEGAPYYTKPLRAMRLYEEFTSSLAFDANLQYHSMHIKTAYMTYNAKNEIYTSENAP